MIQLTPGSLIFSSISSRQPLGEYLPEPPPPPVASPISSITSIAAPNPSSFEAILSNFAGLRNSVPPFGMPQNGHTFHHPPQQQLPFQLINQSMQLPSPNPSVHFGMPPPPGVGGLRQPPPSFQPSFNGSAMPFNNGQYAVMY